jgi:GTPase SAR1 family protein
MPPGQERYQSITNRFYAETKAVVIVYDIVNEESWSDVDFWVRELNYYLPAELDNGIPVLFVGNKRDLVDKRDEEQKVVNFRQVYFLPPPAGPLPLSLPCPFPPTATAFVRVCV